MATKFCQNMSKLTSRDVSQAFKNITWVFDSWNRQAHNRRQTRDYMKSFKIQKFPVTRICQNMSKILFRWRHLGVQKHHLSVNNVPWDRQDHNQGPTWDSMKSVKSQKFRLITADLDEVQFLQCISWTCGYYQTKAWYLSSSWATGVCNLVVGSRAFPSSDLKIINSYRLCLGEFGGRW